MHFYLRVVGGEISAHRTRRDSAVSRGALTLGVIFKPRRKLENRQLDGRTPSHSANRAAMLIERLIFDLGLWCEPP